MRRYSNAAFVEQSATRGDPGTIFYEMEGCVMQEPSAILSLVMVASVCNVS